MQLNKRQWVEAALETYGGRLTRYAARITGGRELAQDVVQDTFVKLCEADPAELDGRLAPWLFTVCRNRALDVRRKEQRMLALNESQAESPVPGPAAIAERSEAAGEVMQALGTLSANQQEVVRLKFQEGLSYKEISQVTGLTASNVGFLLHTAIKKVRQRLYRQSETPAQTNTQPDAGRPKSI